MEFTASLDGNAKAITVGACIVFTALCIWNIYGIKKARGDKLNIVIRAGIFIVLVFAVAASFIYSTKGYETRGKNLIVKSRFGEMVLKWNKIMDVRQVSEEEMAGLSRGFGVGGLFGYKGHYHNPSIGDMTFYATQQKNWVLVHLVSGEAIMLTPDDPKKLVDEVTSIITPNN